MAAVNDVPQLVDKKGGSYAAIAPKLEPGKFNKWKKRMLCYLAGMEPYYLKCIKDGPFQPKTAEGDAKPESQWTPDERRVVVQDQRLKSIIMSCLPDDIMESVISCVSAKETWTDLVHSFEGPSDTKENRIMDLKLEYQTFKARHSSIKLLAQSSVNPSAKKAPMIPKPSKECKYYGFNDHHSDNCEYYPECEVCGSVAHEPADYPKKHPNNKKPIIDNKRSTKPTKKWVHKKTNLCELYVHDYLKRSVWYLDSACSRHMIGVKQHLHRYSKESGPKVVFRDDSSGDIE
ncbi:hypothetical protein Tco_0955135 [Tanacetum coccineum]|uniref:Retrovirus-related Pol polyprotein from transposon TNT 1-94 n=1 Tax=Tanacetum coccineum TaxID=301880 RepID=A0ABQ5E6D2_9ASTR